MAGNNSIQFVRGTSSKRASHTETSLAGQPIYETDTNRLYVGDGETSVNDLTAVEASAADIAENVKDQNNGAGIKIWIGTQAEFEDLETDEDTIYYITDIVSLLELDEALTTLKEQLTSGAFKVGKAGAADNVTAQIKGNAIDSILESDGVTAKKASKFATPRALPVNLALSSENASKFDGSADISLGVTGTLPVASGGTGQTNLDNVTVGKAKSATSATNANNVESTINDIAITSIFESNGTTAKKATRDANGNVINTTYATKTELVPKANQNGSYMTLSAGALILDDTRSVNSPPSYYYGKGSRVTSEFKNCSTVGLPEADTYCTVVTVCPWTDDSGGAVTQTAYIGDKVYIRKSTSDSQWGSWASVLAIDSSKLISSTANGWTEITDTDNLPGAGVYLVGATIDTGSSVELLSPSIMVFNGTHPAMTDTILLVLDVMLVYIPSVSTKWIIASHSSELTGYSINNVYYKRIA